MEHSKAHSPNALSVFNESKLTIKVFLTSQKMVQDKERSQKLKTRF